MGIYIFGTGGGDNGNRIDLSNDDIQPSYVLQGRRFHDRNYEQKIGTIPNADNSNVIDGESVDSNKIRITPKTNAQHISAGKYLSRDIEVSPMDQGTANVTFDRNYAILNRGAGYMPDGTSRFEMPAGALNYGRDGNKILIYKSEGYIESGTDEEIVPLQDYDAGTISSNNTYTWTPGTGYAGFGQVKFKVEVNSGGAAVTHPAPEISSLNNDSSTLKIQHYQSAGLVPSGTTYATYDLRNYAPYLRSDYIRDGYKIFGVTGSYVGGTSNNVYFDGSTSMSIDGTAPTISGHSTMQMVSIMRREATSNLNTIISVMARRGTTTCYFYVPSGGIGTGTATWYDDKVVISLSNSSSWYMTGTYRVMYAYLA